MVTIYLGAENNENTPLEWVKSATVSAAERRLIEFNERFSVMLYKVHFCLVQQRAVGNSVAMIDEKLQKLYEDGIKKKHEFLDAALSERIDCETCATFLYYMSLVAYRVGELDVALEYAVEAYHLTSSPRVQYETLCEYIGAISCIKLKDYESHLHFLRPAVMQSFAEITNDEVFVQQFGNMFRRASGEPLLLMVDVYKSEMKRRNKPEIGTLLQRELEKEGYGTYMRHLI